MTNNKTALLTRLNSFRKELDALVDFVISLEEAQPAQSVPTFQSEPNEWLTPKQVCERLNISYTSFFEWVRQGKLPPGHEFSARSKRWRMSDISAWQEKKQDSTTVNIIVNEPPKRRGRPSKVRRKEEFYV